MSTFFDLVPNEVHDTIAYHLFSSMESCESNPSGLHSLKDDQNLAGLLDYAKNSPTQLRAVMRAMSYTLCPSCWGNQTFTDWISTCGNQLLELNLLDSAKLSFPGVSPLLSRLRKASVRATPDQLYLTRGSPNLSNLTVEVHCSRFWDHLVSTVGSLPLTVLEVFFGLETCKGFIEPSRIELVSLRAACQAVEHLKLRGYIDLSPVVWDMIKGFRSLRKVAIPAKINDQHVPFLKTLSEVELFGRNSLERAQSLSTCLTGLHFAPMLRYEKVMSVASLPNLQRLSISLFPSAELALVGVIDKVEELSLSWWFEHDFEPIQTSLLPCRRVYPVYHEPDGEVLENILRRTKRLRSLKVKRAIMTAEVIERLLEIIGENLENFEISQDWQKLPTAPRMERILKAVAQNCPKLGTLNFLEDCSRCDLPILSTKQQKYLCAKALGEVIKAAPKFLSHRKIRHTIEKRFTDNPSPNDFLWEDIVPLRCFQLL